MSKPNEMDYLPTFGDLQSSAQLRLIKAGEQLHQMVELKLAKHTTLPQKQLLESIRSVAAQIHSEVSHECAIVYLLRQLLDIKPIGYLLSFVSALELLIGNKGLLLIQEVYKERCLDLYRAALDDDDAGEFEDYLPDLPIESEEFRQSLLEKLEILLEESVFDSSRHGVSISACLAEGISLLPLCINNTKYDIPHTLPQIRGYEIKEIIGRGGMGIVYRAIEFQTDRTVALKMVSATNLARPSDLQRFRRESRIACILDHPNILPVFSVGEYEGSHYYTMQLLTGGTLEKKAANFRSEPNKAVQIVEKVARAIHHAHQHGLIHRDLKPANILLDGENKPHVVDFGLAKRIESESGLTRVGELMGTPEFMAPEQARCERKLTTAVDVYALGGILYYLLSGKPPFKSFSILDTLKLVTEVEPKRPSAYNHLVPHDVEVICLKCLDKEPKNRYDTADDLADDLQRYLEDKPIFAREVGKPERIVKWMRRHPKEMILTSTACLFAGLVVGDWAWQRHMQQIVNRQSRAAAIVETLKSAHTSSVITLLDSIPALEPDIKPLLHNTLEKVEKGSREELHIRLALLHSEPEQLEQIIAWIPRLLPEEVQVVQQRLLPYKEKYYKTLWLSITDSKLPDSARLRFAGIFAGIEPKNPVWERLAPNLAGWIVSENLLNIGYWADIFRPIKEPLQSPLANIYFDINRRQAERDLSITLLADYAADRPGLIADLVVFADSRQLELIWSVLFQLKSQTVPMFQKIIDSPRIMKPACRANAAIVLAKFNIWEPTWTLLGSEMEPETRSWLIHRLGSMGVDQTPLLNRMYTEKNPHIRMAIILALGEFSVGSISENDREVAISKLTGYYRNDPNSGVHSAISWLLRQKWDRSMLLDTIDAELQGKEFDKHSWKLNGRQQTFVTMKSPIIFRMGSPIEEPDREEDLEKAHVCRILREYSISTREVSVDEFLAFRKDFKYRNRYSPTSDSPMINVRWYDAVAYCRWLSEKEGIPEDQMCYPPLEQIGPGMRLSPDLLNRTGYRLPTEAEWEYACRGGSTAARCYGDDPALLQYYGWYAANSGDRGHKVASVKPNDYGLFDMHGNAWEWCNDRQRDYPQKSQIYNDVGQTETVNDTDKRVIRGGAFGWHAALVRSARRNSQFPNVDYHLYGFRIARTIATPKLFTNGANMNNSSIITKIVSGGQTGADRAALDLALELSVPCSGWCPRGRKAEDGILPPRYPLMETPTDVYAERTEWNVRDSDGTLLFVMG